MEIWLKLNNDSNNGSFSGSKYDKIDFRFPVVPPEFDLEISKIINSVNITKFGEATSYAGNNASSIPLSSFFPSKNYSFCSYSDFPKPYDCVAIIKSMMLNNKIPRLIITDTDVNMPVLIESFNYGKKDGTDDVFFDIKFKEYKKIEIPKVEDPNSSNNNQNNNRPSDNNSSSQQKIHTVVKGDNMWDISQKYLGKGSIYKKINEANWNTYPSLKKNNIIYVGWKLVIPKV